MRIFDTIMVILFVLFMIFMIVGFNKQMIEKNKKRKNQQDRKKDEFIDRDRS